LNSSREHINHAQAIDDYSYLCCLDGFARFLETPAVSVGEASGSVARVGTVKACQRSHLSFDHGGQVSELLTQEGQGREVRVNSSRESGK